MWVRVTWRELPVLDVFCALDIYGNGHWWWCARRENKFPNTATPHKHCARGACVTPTERVGVRVSSVVLSSTSCRTMDDSSVDEQLALNCLKHGSTWTSAGLRERQAFLVHRAYSINIPMRFYKPSARNFSDYRRDDVRAKRFFDALMFFLHLIEHAVNQVATRTTVSDRQRALAAAAQEQTADDAGAVRTLERYAGHANGSFFDAGASPMNNGGDSLFGFGATPPRNLPPFAVPSSTTSQADRDLEELLQDVLGDVSSDGEEPVGTGLNSNTPAPRVATASFRTPVRPVAPTVVPLAGQRAAPAPAFDLAMQPLSPAIYLLLEQVPRDGRRVPGEGKFHELLDMLQVQPPTFYTLHVLLCGVDFAALMATTLAMNTLRAHELPVYTAMYRDTQRINLFARMAIEETAASGARRGRGGRGRGRGGRGGRGTRGRGRGGRGRQVNNHDDEAEEDSDEEHDEEYSSQVMQYVEDARKRRPPRIMPGSQPQRRQPWESYQSVTFETLGNVYADIFSGAQEANVYYSRHPAGSAELAISNPCHPDQMFGVNMMLISRGPNISYTQSLQFYARYQEQYQRAEQYRRRQCAFRTHNEMYQRPEEPPERDALDLAPRCPYVSMRPECYPSEGIPAVYVWTPPPGAAGRFLALNITEATAAAFCNKALPHRQRPSSVLEDVWPGLFGKRAVSRTRVTKTADLRMERIGQSLRPADLSNAAGTADVDDASIEDYSQLQDLYDMLPANVRDCAEQDDDNLAGFGPPVRCLVVNGQEMSIKRVQYLLELMQHRAVTIGAAKQEVTHIEARIEALQEKLRRSTHSSRVSKERARRHGDDSQTMDALDYAEYRVARDNAEEDGLRVQRRPREDADDSLLERGMSSSGFSFAQMNLEHYLRSTNSCGSRAMELEEQDNGDDGHTRFVLEPEDRAMGFGEHNDRFGRLLSQSACSTSAIGGIAMSQPSSIDQEDEDEEDDVPMRRTPLSAAMRLEPASRSMPALGAAHRPEQARHAIGMANVNRVAPSDASIRAQHMQQRNINHSDAHIVRTNCNELREQLEQLKDTLCDMRLLCNESIRADLVHARNLYDYQMRAQTQWVKSVRALLTACKRDDAATRDTRAREAADHESGVKDLEGAMARAPAPTPLNEAAMLLRGYYARRSTERTGQLLVDIGEHQRLLWTQLNDRLLDNSTQITEHDARAWTIIHERSALCDFKERVNDPSANIPTALSVVFESAQRQSLHKSDGRMMHYRMDDRLGAMENHFAYLLETYNAIFCIAKCQLTLMGWISSQCATHHANELHPNLLVMGDAAASKTYPLAVLHQLRCNLGSRDLRKTTIESTRETEKSSSHDGRHMMDYQVFISNEMLKSVLVGDPLEGSTGSATIKQLFDHCQSFIQTLERNPETSQFEFKERFASYIGVRIMCANWSMAELPLPILTRVILVPCMPARGARNNIAQAMARRQEQRLADEKKVEQLQKYHNFLHYMQAMGDAMIVCGAMKDVNLWMVSFVTTYINQELKRRSMVTIQPRFLQHINSWVRAVVKQSVYAREFSYVGGIFQKSDVTPERLQLLQPYLYADMRTVIFVMGTLMRYSSIEGEDDVRKAVRSIIDKQRETLRLGLDSTRTVDDMFRIKGYTRMTTAQAEASQRQQQKRASNASSTSRAFVPNIPVNELIDNDFSMLDGEDSMSGLPPVDSPSMHNGASTSFQSNFPGLREQIMQQPPPGTRGILGVADDTPAGKAYRPYQYDGGFNRGNGSFNQHMTTVKTRDYRYITLRIGDGKGNVASRMDPKQWTCMLGAKRLMPMLNECNSTVTCDMVCALLMLLSEQYIKSPYYKLDARGVPEVHLGGRTENIRVVEFEMGFMHISYCWLMILDVSVMQVMRDMLVKLNSYRHQPRQRCLWQHDEMFPNTFETLDIGNEDCDNERHPVLELENPAYYSDDELRVLYDQSEMEHHQAKRVPLVRINCSLDHLAATKREAELRWHNSPVTECDLARVLYSAERLFGADHISRYHNVQFTAADMSHLENTMCLYMPDQYYQVPNEAWTVSSPPSVPRTVAHWDALLADEPDVEKRRRIYCTLSYFTDAAVINDRMSRWERFVSHEFIQYPEALHQRFMPRVAEGARSLQQQQQQAAAFNLLEEELNSRRNAPMSHTERQYANECRDAAHASILRLKQSQCRSAATPRTVTQSGSNNA